MAAPFLSDSDEFDIARVTAIECLVTWACLGMAPRIADKLDDPSPIVRAYCTVPLTLDKILSWKPLPGYGLDFGSARSARS